MAFAQYTFVKFFRLGAQLVKPALNTGQDFSPKGFPHRFVPKSIAMKNTTLFLLALLALFSFPSCDDDPYPLELQTFDVRWYDDDNSSTQTVGDALTFGVQINSTDPDSDDQYIIEWDFSYFVNDNFGGILRGDEHIQTNSLFFDAEVVIGNLTVPSAGFLGQGDVVEFRLWARDNHGTELERIHRYVIEE